MKGFESSYRIIYKILSDCETHFQHRIIVQIAYSNAGTLPLREKRSGA